MSEKVILSHVWENNSGSYRIDNELALVRAVIKQLKNKWFDLAFRGFSLNHLSLENNEKMKNSKEPAALLLSQV